MKKIVGLTTAAVTILLVTATGCEDQVAFYIFQNQVPKTGCVVSTDQQTYRAQGLLDVSLGIGYTLYPLLHNDLPVKKTTGTKSSRPEPNLLHLKEFHVQLDLGQVASKYPNDLLRFSRPTSGVLTPGGRRASSVEIIPSNLVKQLEIPANARPMIMAEVTAVAENGEGDLIDSMPFFYPVSLCDGCLVVVLPSCSPDIVSSQTSSSVCGLPQDDSLVCCNEDTGLRCPAGL